MPETTHRCPPPGEGLMPCCGKTPFEVPRHERLTVDDDDVTCGRPTPEPALTAAQLGYETNTFTMLVPTDELIAYGHLNPTKAQVLQARAEIPARYAHEVEAWTQTRAFLAQVEATEWTPLARNILELHGRSEHNECGHCDGGVGGGEWPCATARLVFTDLGIDVPDSLIYDTPVLPVNDGTNPFWPYPMGPLRIRDLFPFVKITEDSGPLTHGAPE